MHHVVMEESCVDIDRVLCLDPTGQQNDDGEAYRRFLSEALPLHATSRRIGYLVTSRLEKYRHLTEAWLKAQGIEYGRLVMLDLPSAAERRRLGAHGSFKAEFYRKSDATLFIESEHEQAEMIARLSGKPVLCIETNRIHLPDSLSPVAPFRVVNIGNGAPVPLLDFIAAIEDAAGRPAERQMLPMQPGDVPATWADATLLTRLLGHPLPKTDIRDGVARFVEWYRDYYGV